MSPIGSGNPRTPHGGGSAEWIPELCRAGTAGGRWEDPHRCNGKQEMVTKGLFTIADPSVILQVKNPRNCFTPCPSDPCYPTLLLSPSQGTGITFLALSASDALSLEVLLSSPGNMAA